MEQKALTQKNLRQRKLFLMLPIMALPFLTLFFWAMGGGSTKAIAATSPIEKGINANLPNPNFKDDKALDKLSYYDRATEDSLEGKAKNDRGAAYLRSNKAFEGEENVAQEPTQVKPSSRGLNSTAYRNPAEEKVYKRLEALQKAIDNPTMQEPVKSKPSVKVQEKNTNPEINRLESMMASMNDPTEADPELQQLGSMLERIVDIQHPERVQQRLKEQSEKMRGQVFPVTPYGNPENVSVLENGVRNFGSVSNYQGHGFYSLDDEIADNYAGNAITAVIHETQTLVNGAVIKLRLTSDIMVNGVTIPKDHFVFGTVSLKGERLTVTIESLQYDTSIFQVDLAVYDMDGMEGIYVPGAIARDVAKSSADRSVQSLGVTTIDDSWSSQAMGAGIEAGKTLFSKKVKLVKVVVKAGYQVLLYDEKANKK
ncbi:conjugative transposon protein TraM [Flavobacterium sp. Sd200]|uniref:conjugative transposon protein TraM n=1 Tax=Flavobacterium sp. Sd200 TaxID=2692211 RepID=UPI0013714F64|nr:conjugative transposon protein TraM [Flavobacterium sp. Sd200]MXN91741.1 conjugative transposon protein TraM [Flavobacterium sp. Sd200]